MHIGAIENKRHGTLPQLSGNKCYRRGNWQGRAGFFFSMATMGYDYQHGYHHRHYFRRVGTIEFVSFEEVGGKI